ncbi:MAG: thioredoxin [Firmicutes bacterium]|nr:thioredoxin [Bacillota bacterium]HOB35785.1 thioredoxin [Bacillota bacterium]HPZ91408.1 thioredoxin [Bacillota bacterium]HQE01474.1 thioredoxin [Bacillota bacterium]
MMIKNVTQADFEQEVLQAEGPVLVDFWAAWCGPCRMVAPVLEEVDQELGDSLKIAKVNVDEEGELAQKYGIMSIPTLMLFKGGRVVETTVGFQPKKELIARIQPHL